MHIARMHRFVATLVVLSLLLGGAAWAADNCDEALMGVADHLLDGNSDGKSSPQPAKSPADFCSHCAHGHAHLLGVLPPNGEIVLLNGMAHQARVPRLHPSLTQRPPIQPPRI